MGRLLLDPHIALGSPNVPDAASISTQEQKVHAVLVIV
jgi:hypothetical protein